MADNTSSENSMTHSNADGIPTRDRLLVVGARGYIGKRLMAAAETRFDVRGTSSSGGDGLLALDLGQPEKFDMGAVRPGDVCLLTAAISSPDICASKHDFAWSVNVIGTSAFIQRLLDQGARVVFFSSDTVYGQREVPFDETSACTPAGEYAVMKHAVEKQFLGNPGFKSIRLSYVFSREDKFTRYLAGCAQRGEEAELFHPFYRAIVHREDVVEGALALAAGWDAVPESVVNFAGPQVLSRLEFADILRQESLPTLKTKRIEPADDFFEKRPRVIAMTSTVLGRLLGRPARPLREAARIELPPQT